jgi:hypothetical protein
VPNWAWGLCCMLAVYLLASLTLTQTEPEPDWALWSAPAADGGAATSAAPTPAVTTTDTPARASSASPTPATPRQRRVLVLDLKASARDEVDANLARTLTNLVAEAVTHEPDVAVTSGQDLQALLDQSATKQAFGCDDKLDECVAQLAGALDADLVISGTIGRLDDVIIVSLTAYDARAQAAVARVTAQGETARELPREIDAAVAKMFGRVEAPSPLAMLVPVGAVVGSIGLVGAAVFGGWTAASTATIVDPESKGADKQAARDSYAVTSGLAFASTAVVVAGVVTAGIGAFVE